MYSSQQVTLVPDSLFSVQKHKSYKFTYMPSAYSENVVVNHIKPGYLECIINSNSYILHVKQSSTYGNYIQFLYQYAKEWYLKALQGANSNHSKQKRNLDRPFITENGRLTLHNQYNYLNHTDMCYFVANAVDQLSIDADKLIIRLIGDIDQQSEEIPL